MTAGGHGPENHGPSGDPRLHDCTYEIYLAVFKEARAAAKAADATRLDALRARASRREGAAREAALLALADVAGKTSRRTKFEVCRPLCDTRCERGV